jgi:neurofibromin 1
MNQIVMNSQNQQVIDSIKNILITACSDPNFSTAGRNPKEKLEELAFLSLADPTFGADKMCISHNAKLASRLLEAITDQP